MTAGQRFIFDILCKANQFSQPIWKKTGEHVDSLIKEADHARLLDIENERLRAEATRLRTLLKKADDELDNYGLGRAGRPLRRAIRAMLDARPFMNKLTREEREALEKQGREIIKNK